MLGSAAYRLFASSKGISVTGTARSVRDVGALPRHDNATIVGGVDATDTDAVISIIAQEKPDVVVNCVGIIKQLAASKDALTSIAINSLFPHRLAQICAVANARLIQISTDCVFSGDRGGYCESDLPDARDLYGRSKLLGEVDYPHAITLRTSIIGMSSVDLFRLSTGFSTSQGPRCPAIGGLSTLGFPPSSSRGSYVIWSFRTLPCTACIRYRPSPSASSSCSGLSGRSTARGSKSFLTTP
jgi:dTDP-4-dehydrorhamnose reductase